MQWIAHYGKLEISASVTKETMISRNWQARSDDTGSLNHHRCGAGSFAGEQQRQGEAV